MAKQAYVYDGTQWVPINNSINYPDQSGNEGKFLSTNGSSVYWAVVDLTQYATLTSVTDDIATHAADTIDVHGIADTSQLVVNSQLLSHTDATTNVHGIADTSTLATLNSPTFTGTVTVENLTVTGTQTINATQTISVSDPQITMAAGQYSGDNVDVGFSAEYGIVNGNFQNHYHTGLIRDWEDKKWRLFSNVPHPVNEEFNFTNAVYDTLVLGKLEVTSTELVANLNADRLDGQEGSYYASTVSPTFTGKTTVDQLVVNEVFEKFNSVPNGATGTVFIDVLTNMTYYYTANATANWTFNIRGDATNTLNNTMQTGESATITFLVTQGATAYRATTFQIDGVAITPKWADGVVPSAGNASGIDVYSLTVIKTGNATYTLFASLAGFK
jgi:hypothetical protein